MFEGVVAAKVRVSVSVIVGVNPTRKRSGRISGWAFSRSLAVASVRWRGSPGRCSLSQVCSLGERK